MGTPKELVKKINKRLLELHKIYSLARSNIRDARWADSSLRCFGGFLHLLDCVKNN